MNKSIFYCIALALAGSTTALAQTNKTTTIKIQDVLSAEVPKPDPAKHKDHDAEVYRTSKATLGEGYQLVYYQKEGAKMVYHAAFYGYKDKMRLADYNWNKDTIAVRLYDAGSNKEIRFRAFGHGGSSSLITDDK
jgi:hypothetical protein